MHAVGRLWMSGRRVQWHSLHPDRPQKVGLPTYPFERTRHFIESGGSHSTRHKAPTTDWEPEVRPPVTALIHSVFEKTSGYDLAEFDPLATFFDMGMDSLVLTQTASAMKKEFGVDITFRQMLE